MTTSIAEIVYVCFSHRTPFDTAELLQMLPYTSFSVNLPNEGSRQWKAQTLEECCKSVHWIHSNVLWRLRSETVVCKAAHHDVE